MAAHDDLYDAVLRNRSNLHDHDLARRGVESGLLPGVRAGGEVGCIAGGGIPAVDEIRIVGDLAGDALFGFYDAREIRCRRMGAEGTRLLGHISLNGFVQFAAGSFGGLREGSFFRRRDLFRGNGGESDGGRKEEGAKGTHSEGSLTLSFVRPSANAKPFRRGGF